MIGSLRIQKGTRNGFAQATGRLAAQSKRKQKSEDRLSSAQQFTQTFPSSRQMRVDPAHQLKLTRAKMEHSATIFPSARSGLPKRGLKDAGVGVDDTDELVCWHARMPAW